MAADGPVIPPEVAALAGTGVAVVAATRDAALRPEITRAWGLLLDPELWRAEFCLRGPADSPTVANIAANGRLALNLTSPTTYRAVQFKGVAEVLGDPTDEQLERAAAHLVRFSAEAEEVGVPRELARYFSGSLGAYAVLEIRELYDQTPGPRAGRAL